jgi:D-glycero-D-manno-heptose 1,7-bisphosphate phosphatase
MNKKLIILDRDGVINHDSAAYIKSAEEWIPLPNSLEAIALLKKNGYQVAVATNQSGLAKGLYDLGALEAMHTKMQTLLEPLGGSIDAIFFCPHDDRHGCDCRKPKPGLLKQAAHYFQIDLAEQVVPFIGDSLRDLEAGYAAGCAPILVLTGNGQKTAHHLRQPFKAIPIYDNLYTAVEVLLKSPEARHVHP